MKVREASKGKKAIDLGGVNKNERVRGRMGE